MNMEMNVKTISEKNDLTDYFRQNLRKIEDLAPSDAVVSGELKEDNNEVEVSIKIDSVDWESRCKKVDSNPYLAIDMAVGEVTTKIFQRKDMIDWSFF